MTRLAWGSAGERFFESGADRGVLYLPNEEGVAWNGLKSVSESPDGGTPTPYYVDGYKYINVASAEDFKATISAFSAPAEFGICDGTALIHNGLFATQQPRKAFGLSYRTRVGNDIEGVDHGYKIHLVYNALAAPSTRESVSLSNSPTPTSLSWAISTTPPKITGLRPTAHFVIDSRMTPWRLLAKIEDILYGTGSTSPRLPSVDEIMSIFSGPPDILVTNVVTNPAARVDITGWAASSGGAGAATLDRITGSPTTPPETQSSSYFRITCTTVGTWFRGLATIAPGDIQEGSEYEISTWTKGTSGMSVRVMVIWRDSANVTILENTSEYFNLASNSWQRKFLRATAPPGATRGYVGVVRITPAVGEFIDIIGMMMSKEGGDYVDGALADTEFKQYEFLGADHISPSVLRTWY